MKTSNGSVAARVAALPTLPTADLWSLWDRYFARRPENPNREYLESRIAYKIQEEAYGGLCPETGQRLANIGIRHSKIKERRRGPRKNQAIVGQAVTYQIPAPAGAVQLETFIPLTLVKRGVKREVITPLDAPEEFHEEAAERQGKQPAEDSALIRALGLAHYWSQLLDAGKAKTPADIARLEAMNVVQVRKILRLILLAPDIIEATIVDARAPRRLTLEFLLRRSITRDWEEQRRRLVGSDAF